MNKFLLALIILLLLSGCGREVEQVHEELRPEEELVQEALDGDEIARRLVQDRGKILEIRRVFDMETPHLEVLVEEEEGLFLYSIDPVEEVIVSIDREEKQAFDIHRAYFLAREILPGTDKLQSIIYREGNYILTLIKDEEAYEVALDEYSLGAQLLGQVELEEIYGRIKMDLFQAMDKFKIIYGDIDLKELYFKSGDDYSAFIILGGDRLEDGEKIYRSYVINAYNGLIEEDW